MAEFNFLRAQAVEPLSQFLDFITCVFFMQPRLGLASLCRRSCGSCVCVRARRYEYMIDNVILLLKGTLNGRDVNELIHQVLRQFDFAITCASDMSN